MNGNGFADRDEDRGADAELEQLLKSARFAVSPRFQARLHTQLLNRLAEQKERTMGNVFQALVRPLLVSAVSAAAVLVVMMSVSPEARATAGGWMSRFVEVPSPPSLAPRSTETRATAPPELTVPAPADLSTTSASKPLPAPATAAAPAPAPPERSSGLATPAAVPPSEQRPADRRVAAVTPPSGREQPAPVPPAQPTRDLISLLEAQSRVAFQIRTPAVLPAGYKLLGAVPPPALPGGAPTPPLPALPKLNLPADAPRLDPPQMIILLFGNDGGEVLTLSEARMLNPAGVQAPLPAGAGSVSNVTVNGLPAQYVEGTWGRDGTWTASGHHQLHWQDGDGIVYDLGSATLGLEPLLALANSLR